MIYKEEQRDLFSVSPDYYLVHCISADFKMGAGIAKKFTEMGTRARVQDLLTTSHLLSLLTVDFVLLTKRLMTMLYAGLISHRH